MVVRRSTTIFRRGSIGLDLPGVLPTGPTECTGLAGLTDASAFRWNSQKSCSCAILSNNSRSGIQEMAELLKTGALVVRSAWRNLCGETPLAIYPDLGLADVDEFPPSQMWVGGKRELAGLL